MGSRSSIQELARFTLSFLGATTRMHLAPPGTGGWGTGGGLGLNLITYVYPFPKYRHANHLDKWLPKCAPRIAWDSPATIRRSLDTFQYKLLWCFVKNNRWTSLIGDAFISYDRHSIQLIKITSILTKQAIIINKGQIM